MPRGDLFLQISRAVFTVPKLNGVRASNDLPFAANPSSGNKGIAHIGSRSVGDSVASFFNSVQLIATLQQGLWRDRLPRRLLASAVVILLIHFQGSLLAEGEHPTEGWSQDLLARLLTTPVPDSASRGASTQGGEGVVLRSYQLRSLHLGDPGRATNLVSILQRMLPPDSRVTEDRPGNTLHVLSTGAAQQAGFELIAAMDAEAMPARPASETAVLPDEVRKALESLATARPDSEQLMKVVADSSRRTEERLSEVVRQSQEESKGSLRRMAIVGGGSALALLVVSLGIFLLIVRRSQKKDLRHIAEKSASSLALVPSQSMEVMMSTSRDQQERTKDLQKLMESFSIAYQADRQRNSMIMETVAKKHGELASTLTQMEQLRRDMGDDAGKIFLEVNRHAIDRIVSQASEALQSRAAEVGLIAETASKKMEETANRLEVQNARASVLAEELERTQKEVDALFEKLKSAQEAAQKAQNEANEQRRIAYEKTAELTRKEAALAGLALLMQEPASEILDTLNRATADPSPSAENNTASSIFNPTPPDDLVPGLSPPDLNEPNSSADLLRSPSSESSPCSTHPYTFRITPVT